MLRCAKCGSVMPAFEVKYRVTWKGSRTDFCPKCYKEEREAGNVAEANR